MRRVRGNQALTKRQLAQWYETALGDGLPPRPSQWWAYVGLALLVAGLVLLMVVGVL